MIRVHRSIVTGIRIDGATLHIEGVDQDKDGNTLKSHTLAFPEGALVGEKVVNAIETLTEFAQQVVDDA